MKHIFLFILSICIIATNNIHCSSKEELLEEELLEEKLEAERLQDEQKSQEKFYLSILQQFSEQQVEDWWQQNHLQNVNGIRKLYQRNSLIAQLKNQEGITALAQSIQKKETKLTDALLEIMLQRWNMLLAYEQRKVNYLRHYPENSLFDSVGHLKKTWQKQEAYFRARIIQEFPGITEVHRSTEFPVFPEQDSTKRILPPNKTSCPKT